MRVTGIGMTLHGEEGAASPPLPYIEVDDNEGNTLIALYPAHVAIVSDAVDADTDEPREPLGLFGSDQWGSTILIGEDAVILGDVVRSACGDMPASEWNGLDPELRESFIAAEVRTLRRDAGRDPDTNEAPNPEQLGNDPEVIDAINGGAPLDVDQGTLVEGEPGPSDVVDGGTGGTGGETNTEMADAIDLLDPLTGFVKNGARKGRPKVEAVADILGRDVTIAEIDAAFIAKTATE